MKQLSKEQFLSLIQNEIDAAGSQLKLAEKWGVPQPYISNVVRGRQDPGPAILTAMNAVSNITYSVKETDNTNEKRNTRKTRKLRR